MESEKHSLLAILSSPLWAQSFVVIEFQCEWIYNCEPGIITGAYCRTCNPSAVSFSPLFLCLFHFPGSHNDSYALWVMFSGDGKPPAACPLNSKSNSILTLTQIDFLTPQPAQLELWIRPTTAWKSWVNTSFSSQRRIWCVPTSPPPRPPSPPQTQRIDRLFS